MTNFLWLLYRYHLDTLFMIFWICFEWMAGIPCKSRDSYLYSVTRQVFFNKTFSKLKEMVLHHACCITCATIAVYTGTYSGYAMVGLSMEVNSIFLHARSAQRLNFNLQNATKVLISINTYFSALLQYCGQRGTIAFNIASYLNILTNITHRHITGFSLIAWCYNVALPDPDLGLTAYTWSIITGTVQDWSIGFNISKPVTTDSIVWQVWTG